MLLRCCLISISIIIPRHFLYFVDLLWTCLGLGLLMSYLCDLFSNFIFIFIITGHIISLKQTHLFFEHLLENVLLFLDDNVDEESEQFSNSKSFATWCCSAFAWSSANFSLVLLVKLLLTKKRVFCRCQLLPTLVVNTRS